MWKQQHVAFRGTNDPIYIAGDSQPNQIIGSIISCLKLDCPYSLNALYTFQPHILVKQRLPYTNIKGAYGPH